MDNFLNQLAGLIPILKGVGIAYGIFFLGFFTLCAVMIYRIWRKLP
jgi:hypothetical protein